MIEEIHFISLVVNGIHIIIHNVIWYNYTNTNTNNSINSCIFVQIPFVSPIQIQMIVIICILVQISIISLTIFENFIIK